MTLKVLHVIPSIAASDGGPSRAMITMERALALAGVAVVTATTNHGQETCPIACKEVDIGHAKITRFFARKRVNFYKIAPNLVPWLWGNITSFDAVHIHALFSFSSVVAALMARVRGVPYVVRPLGTLTRYGMMQRAYLKRASFSLIEAPILRKAAAVHFTSNEEWEEASSLNVAMRGVVIPLGVEEHKLGDGARLDAEYPVLKRQTAILFLSRLDPKKNLEVLLDAFARIAPYYPNSRLLIAGEGNNSYVDELKKRVRALDLVDRVIWLGHVEGQRKQDLWARADIFVLPSFSENFGIAAVEAMLAGLPCVIGKGVAVASNAAAEGAVIAVEPQLDEVAFALNRLLADEDLRRQIGVKAREHAKHNYSTEAMASALKELYADILISKK